MPKLTVVCEDAMKRTCVQMHYGKSMIDIEVPEDRVVGVADLNRVEGVENEGAEIERALDNPIGHGDFSSWKKKEKRTVVVVDDNTRPTPVHKVLPILLNRLNDAGIADRDISVLIALGTHRTMNDYEVKEKVGEEALRRVSVSNHHWKQKEMFRDLGKTPTGIPLFVDRTYLDASIRIGVGHIVPHCQAGWTGGAKIVQPGVCGAETTDYTHWLSARFDVRRLLGVVENPVRLEIERIVSHIGLDFIVNLVLNDKREIVNAVSGDFVAAHREGVKKAKKIFGVKVSTLADVVVCESYPITYGIDLWQAGKAIIAAYLAVKKGGTIILLSPCVEGVSREHPELSKFGHRRYVEIQNLVETGSMKDVNAAATSAQIGQILADKVKVFLYSDSISRKETEQIGFEHADDVQDVVDRSLEIHGSNSKILFLKNACEILPITSL